MLKRKETICHLLESACTILGSGRRPCVNQMKWVLKFTSMEEMRWFAKKSRLKTSLFQKLSFQSAHRIKNFFKKTTLCLQGCKITLLTVTVSQARKTSIQDIYQDQTKNLRKTIIQICILSFCHISGSNRKTQSQESISSSFKHLCINFTSFLMTKCHCIN